MVYLLGLSCLTEREEIVVCSAEPSLNWQIVPTFRQNSPHRNCASDAGFFYFSQDKMPVIPGFESLGGRNKNA
jgi:hypothetical protein